MKKTALVLATAAAAAVALSGCNTSLPNFGPWPIATEAEYGGNTLKSGYFAPGLWATPNALPTCKWAIRLNGVLVQSGTRGVVTLPMSASPSGRFTFESKDCQVWHFVNPGQGRA